MERTEQGLAEPPLAAVPCRWLTSWLRTSGTSPTAALGDRSAKDACPSVPRQPDGSTHRVEEHRQKQFTAVDDFVQLTGATGVFVVEDGVREEATGLPGEYLGQEKDMDGAGGGARTMKWPRSLLQAPRAESPSPPQLKRGPQALRGQD